MFDEKHFVHKKSLQQYKSFTGDFQVKGSKEIITRTIDVEKDIKFGIMNSFIIIDGKKYHWDDVDLLEVRNRKTQIDFDIEELKGKVSKLYGSHWQYGEELQRIAQIRSDLFTSADDLYSTNRRISCLDDRMMTLERESRTHPGVIASIVALFSLVLVIFLYLLSH